MDSARRFVQEGTPVAAGHTDVPRPSDIAAPTPPAHPAAACLAVTEVLSRVGDKWSMQIVMRLAAGPQRFNALKRMVDGISQRMLTRSLRGLERDGLVSRSVTASVPPRVDYALTELGRSLAGPVSILGEWAVTNRETVARAREAYDARQD